MPTSISKANEFGTNSCETEVPTVDTTMLSSQETEVPAADTTISSSHKDDAVKESPIAVGKTFIYNMWYYALAGETLKRGKMQQKKMLGELVLIGRDENGKVFALKDICPHQAVSLSAGSFDGCKIECCFHGWSFDTKGVCTGIPSLVEDQKLNLHKIQTGSYPCVEVQDSVWVYFADKSLKQAPAEMPEVPYAPGGLENYKYDKTTCTLQLPTHIDYAVAALIDTAHVPYVHNSWWWRSKKAMKEKAKLYVPEGNGWTIVKHKPSKHSVVFKLIADYIETEISFRLPGCRREYISVGERTMLAGITALTPVDETHTELNHTTYWTTPVFKPIVKPIVDYFVGVFLGQDAAIAKMQEQCLKQNPDLIMTVKDAGTPGRWYFHLKREWQQSTAECRAFVNPIKEKVLRWRT